jgi:very-short-patch-repair endonuclease
VQWEKVLERQAGVVTLEQAVRCGLSPDVVQRRAASGRWDRLHPAVYLVGGHPLTDPARLWAAVLWAGGRAVVSGPSAAHLHGMLPRLGATVEVTVPRSHHPRPRPDVRVRRRDLPGSDLARRAGFVVTAAPLTVLDTTLELSDPATFLDRALQRHVRLEDVREAYHRHVGDRGWPAVGALLTAAAVGGESAAERLLVRMLRDAGIEGWVLGHAVGPWRIDVAFPARMVAVEVDGWAWHHDVERFRGDRRKQNALVRAGWTPLRFTWQDLAQRPGAVVAEIRSALGSTA